MTDTDLFSGTARNEGGSVETLGEVEHQEVRSVLLIPPPAHLALGVGGIENFVDISTLYPEEGHCSPSSEKGNEEEETDDVSAGSFLLYRIIPIITVDFSIGLVRVTHLRSACSQPQSFRFHWCNMEEVLVIRSGLDILSIVYSSVKISKSLIVTTQLV